MKPVEVCIIGYEDQNSVDVYNECEKRIGSVFLVDISKLAVSAERTVEILYRNTPLACEVCVIRPRVEDFPFTYIIASTLEEKGALVMPSSRAILACSNRCLLIKELCRFNVKQPKSYFSISPSTAKKLASEFEKVVIKFLKHGGRGVTILESKSSTSEFLDIFEGLAKPFCLQNFVKGQVIKTLVVGSEVYAFKEYPREGEARSNEGRREFVKLGKNINERLVRVSQALGAPCCEIDLIDDGKNQFIIDMSLNPNLRMYQEVSGTNIAAIYSEYIKHQLEMRKGWGGILKTLEEFVSRIGIR